MQGKPGSLVVLTLFAGVALIGGLILAGFVFFPPERLPCAGGEEALNPRDEQNRVLERRETYGAIEDGERFICRRVPHLQDVEGWHLREVEAYRNNDLARVVEGLGLAIIHLRYTNQEAGTYLNVDMTPQLFPFDPPAGATDASVRGEAARLWMEPGHVAVVRWRSNGLDVIARSQLGPDWSSSQLVDLLQHLR